MTKHRAWESIHTFGVIMKRVWHMETLIKLPFKSFVCGLWDKRDTLRIILLQESSKYFFFLMCKQIFSQAISCQALC